jgi:hypothetical protein
MSKDRNMNDRHKDLWEINGPSAGTACSAVYVPRKRKPKQTKEEFKKHRREYMKKYYTKLGLHLGKVGRPSKC